jgi:hypothetical protein
MDSSEMSGDVFGELWKQNLKGEEEVQARQQVTGEQFRKPCKSNSAK